VPPPGVEIGAQVLDITQRYRPDFVIAHLFGRSPSAAIKEFKRNGYPLSKMMGLVWASAEADILAAGGWRLAAGGWRLCGGGRLPHPAVCRRRR
jgi:branched-chain amino acid transport system substrate-binding protein